MQTSDKKPQVTDDEIEKFLRWLPLRHEPDREAARSRLLELIRVELHHVTAESSELTEELTKLYRDSTGLVQTIMTAREMIAALRKEITRLQQWKDSQLAVTPDMQEIGRLLDVPLGESIHDKIVPGIKRLVQELGSIDEAFARRPALSGTESRHEKAYRACEAAARAERTAAQLKAERDWLRLERDADDRDWNLLAKELGVEQSTREEIVKAIRQLALRR